MSPATDFQPVLESPRLILRPHAAEDAGRLQLLAGDILVAQETMNIPHPYEDGMAGDWISGTGDKWRRRTGVEFAIVEKLSGELIGGMSFVELKGDEAEIGYWIGVPYWGQGYCTEAGLAMIAFGKDALCLCKITARHLSTNPGSGRVMQKLGMSWNESRCGPDRHGQNVGFEFYELNLN